ncbi:MAG: c-type cytochrome [Burkholderiaceae bacterium]|nr:MAG: c-type cytochrome [Burkholderiaceae bacterium]
MSNLSGWRAARRLGQALLACGIALFAAAATFAAPEFQDTIAQRVKACTACHGDQGRSGPDEYYPRLAGKPAGYLYNQLLSFRDGRRHYGLMTHMVDLMTDDYLMEIAQYFAALEVPYPPPAALPDHPSAHALARGEQIVLHGDPGAHLPACVACHGTRLTGAEPRFPGLVGLSVDYLTAQLGAFKTGERKAYPPDCMAKVAERLTDADAYAVAHWLANQAVPADSHPAPLGTIEQPVAPDLRCGSAPWPQGVKP